jgi:hypothetical protein
MAPPFLSLSFPLLTGRESTVLHTRAQRGEAPSRPSALSRIMPR